MIVVKWKWRSCRCFTTRQQFCVCVKDFIMTGEWWRNDKRDKRFRMHTDLVCLLAIFWVSYGCTMQGLENTTQPASEGWRWKWCFPSIRCVPFIHFLCYIVPWCCTLCDGLSFFIVFVINTAWSLYFGDSSEYLHIFLDILDTGTIIVTRYWWSEKISEPHHLFGGWRRQCEVLFCDLSIWNTNRMNMRFPTFPSESYIILMNKIVKRNRLRCSRLKRNRLHCLKHNWIFLWSIGALWGHNTTRKILFRIFLWSPGVVCNGSSWHT
jgi:hypothetical protein